MSQNINSKKKICILIKCLDKMAYGRSAELVMCHTGPQDSKLTCVRWRMKKLYLRQNHQISCHKTLSQCYIYQNKNSESDIIFSLPRGWLKFLSSATSGLGVAFYSPLSEHHVSVARNKEKDVLLLRNYLTCFIAYLIELVTILRINLAYRRIRI